MNPLSPSGCSLLIREPGAPVVEFRSVALAGASRIMGSALAGAAALNARVERVFQFLVMSIRGLIHVFNMDRGPCDVVDKNSA